MGTGLRFMMEIKKSKQIKNNSVDINNLTDCHLSIQLSLDGFSFCILNTKEKKVALVQQISFPEYSSTPEKHLQNITDFFEKEELLQKKYNSISVSHVNDLCTLVPRPLFDAQNLKQYIKFNTKIYKNDYIVYDEIENHDMVNVYLPFVNINNYFFDKFGSFEYKHGATILVENLLNLYKMSEQPRVFAHLYERYFEIVVIANGQLLLHNFFTYQTKEDFIYYILFTAEQLHLNPEKFELVLSGTIEKDDDYYQIAYKYIRDVKMLEVRSNYSYSDNFTDDFKRNHFTLLNQF